MPIIEAHNERVTHALRASGRTEALEVGPGDDCAVLTPSTERTVVTTDTLVQNQDFMDPWPGGFGGTRSGGYEVGRKSATQNLADVAAMGARPVSLFASLSLPGETLYGWVEDFARGLVDGVRACGAEDCTIAGGDMGASGEISVTVTALGRTDRPVLRSGAQAGDTLALAGRTGWADAGLRLLLNPLSRPAMVLLKGIANGGLSHEPLPEIPLSEGLLDLIGTLNSAEAAEMLEACERAIDAQMRPVSPVPLGEAARDAGANAMLDVSDGLVKDSGRIARASGVQIHLDEAAVDALAAPLLPVARLLLTIVEHNEGAESPASLARAFVLGGGEDHGLLATFPAEVPEGFTTLGSCRVDRAGRAHSADPLAGGHYGAGHRGSLAAGAVLMNGVPLSELGWEHYGA